jgi:diguanylate cyclase (GGDEF)-like protein
MGHLMIFSTIYLIAASMAPVMGYYAFSLNKKSMINRLFLIICVCMTFWALGFSVVIVAPDEETCAFWTRISAVGYVIIYSVMLHFTLLLTGRGKVLRKRWVYPLLYLPAAVCLYAFVISSGIAQQIYHFKYTDSGWIRTTPSILFDYIFQVYYLFTVLGSLILIGLWKRRSTSPEIRKQANILIFSFVAAFGLGTFTDIINGTYIPLSIPRIAPLIFVIPISTIFHCINRYHFMKAPDLHKAELILNDEHRLPAFRIASIGLILGGIALFLLEYFWWNAGNSIPIIIASALLVVLGGILYYRQRGVKRFQRLDLLLILASMTVTPILTISMAAYGGLSMWAFPIMIIVCALVFNSGELLLSSAISLLFSQVYLASVAVQVNVAIDYRTYISRIVILLFIVVSAYFVHRIYLNRLRENAAQARMQALISGIVANFSLADKRDAPEKMRVLLMALADYFGAEIALVHAVEGEFGNLIRSQFYSTDGSALSPEHMQTCMERWKAYLQEISRDRSASPYEASATPEQAQRMKHKPWLFAPIYEKERPVAFLCMETTRSGAAWTNDQLITLPVISRIVSDALEKLSSEMHIEFMAYYDSLTGLPNRQLFQDRAEQAIHLARRNNRIVGILFLDLDSFKSINDTMGHEGGDQLIQALSRKIADSLRKTDTVARFGGDEFLILINSVDDAENISKVADKIMRLFQEPILLKGQEIFITASAGISVFPADGEDSQTLIKNADIAMYTAKEKGKNQYAFCSHNMKELVQYRVNLSNNLYRALDRNELQVYYQPQIDLQTEKITGLEALLRWSHPEFGMIPPMEFIPLAEQTGLINPIGDWVLEIACAQTMAWKRMGLGALRIAVNLSVVQLRNPNLARHIERILRKTGIDPIQVELEITESTTTKEPDYIIRILNDLKGLGVSISIDDFGTEYSSLNRLKMLPVDRLKMDIQFVRGIDKSPKDQAITMVIINLAKNLDLKLIAEGVENYSQLDFLKNRMCDEVQGFYYYRPMPANEVEGILRKCEMP